MDKKEMHIAIISPLLKITSWMAITPNINANKETSTGTTYSYFIITILISIAAYSLYGMMTYNDVQYKYATYIFLSFISYVVLTISNLSACWGIRLKNKWKLIKLLDAFNDIDKRFNNTSSEHDRIKFYVELISCYLLYIIYVCYDELYQALIYNKSFQFHFFIKKLQSFLSLSLALLIYKLGLHFYSRFKLLNDMLDKCKDNISWMSRSDYAITEINDCYVKLTEMVHLFNDVFGRQILYLSANFVLGLLFAINDAITEMNEIAIGNISMHFWINTALYCFCILILCIPLASSCNSAAEEAKHTPLLCYTLLTYISKKDITRREELVVLASITSPTFSAAAFFNVDHTMLFTLFGSVTSYLIVLIQLKDMKM